eukprot:SAG31_NODE_266_length_18815_cov_17.009243_4_plen_443_part_00
MATDDAALTPVRFVHQKVTENPQSAQVTARFYVEETNPDRDPVAYLGASSFVVRSGFNCAELVPGNEDSARQEGRADVQAGERYFGSTRLITALIDTSRTVSPEEMQQVLRAFLEHLRIQRGDVYLKLVAFSGGDKLLTLTHDHDPHLCVEDFCWVGHEAASRQADYEHLVSTIDNYPVEVLAWEGHDPGSTSFYHSVYQAVQELHLSTRARANVEATSDFYLAPSATTEHLVVFSDVDESAHPVSIPDRDPADDSIRSKMFRLLRQGDLHHIVSLIYIDPPELYPATAADIAELDDTLDVVVHATDVGQLAQLFEQMADRIDREANAWYELRLCPTSAGSSQYMQIASQTHAGSLETMFSGDGFRSGVCADDAFTQPVHSSLCDGRDPMCGFEVRWLCLDPINVPEDNNRVRSLVMPALVGRRLLWHMHRGRHDIACHISA